MRRNDFFKKGFPEGLDSHPPATCLNTLMSENGEYFCLGNIYPNPFYSLATIPFQLVLSGYVRLELYDADGRKLHTLIDQHMKAGTHKVSVDKETLGLSSGSYVYQLIFGGMSGNLKKSKVLTIR